MEKFNSPDLKFLSIDKFQGLTQRNKEWKKSKNPALVAAQYPEKSGKSMQKTVKTLVHC